MRRRNMIKSSAVLALIFCFFSVVGAMAQSVIFLGYDHGYSLPDSHGGVNAFRLTVRFTPPPIKSTLSIENFTATPVYHKDNIDDLNFTPKLTDLVRDPTDEGIWSFSLRPNGKAAIQLGMRVDGITDKGGNGYIYDQVIQIKYKLRIPPPMNAPPVADAGMNVEVNSGTTSVPLDGTGSMDNDGSIATYVWARTGGTTDASGNLINANIAQASFTPATVAAGAADVTHEFTLTVTDDDGATHTDMVTITVNAPPLANAGLDRVVASNATVVTLDGRGSSDSTGPLSYVWMRSLAPNRGTAGDVILTRANTARPTFTPVPLDPGAPDATYGFTLTVMDNDGVTAVDMVEITVTSSLVAQAGGDQSVGSDATVTLDGSGSTRTDSTRNVTYTWVRTGGTMGAAAQLTSPNMLEPTFMADTLDPGANAVIHIFTLTVMDNKGSDPATDTVTITVNPGLVAQAGEDQSVGSGATVTLDGSGSTRSDSNRTVEYAWVRTDGTMGATAQPTSANTLEPTFMADTLALGANAVTHIFTLTVTDNVGSAEATDTVTITVTAPAPFADPDADPVANAGPPQTVASGATVTLDGSKSTKDDRRTIDYLWARTGGTPGKSVTLTGSNTAEPSFTADTLEPEDPNVTHVFTLTVTDDAGETDTDMVTVTVTAVLVNIRVYPSDLTVQEGGSGTYQVSLSESPRREVSVIAFLDHEDVVLENARLEFNAENWDTRQDVRINTVADADKVDDTARIRHRLVADGVAFGQPEIVTVRVRDVDPILRPIRNYLASRATALLNNQPELIRFLKQDETDETDESTQGGNFTLKATGGRLAMDGGFVHDGVWGEVTGSYGNSDSGDTKSVLGSVGIQRKYSENLLVGAMLQFDLSGHDLAGNIGRIDGTVWLVGPYFAARHGSQPLYFEGRLLYGESDNDIRLIDRDLGVRTGSFDTTQLLAQIRVEGEIALSDRDEGPQLIPYADARWIEDRAEAFTDRIGNRFVNRVPGQKVSTGQLELGSNVEIPVAVNHGEMTLTGGLGLVYANTEGDYITSDSRGRGRGEIGFSYVLDDNVRIDFESFYDGIGTSRYEGYGLSLSVEMKF